MTSPTYYSKLLAPELMEGLPPGRLHPWSAAAMQGVCHRKAPSPHLYQLRMSFGRVPSRLPEGVEVWDHALEWGMALARRQDLYFSYVARALFKETFLAEMKKRPPITKPYDLFQLFALFVVGVKASGLSSDPDAAKATLQAIGREAITAKVLSSDDWYAEARNVATRVFQVIEEIEESQATSTAELQS